MGTIFVFVIF